MKYQHLGGPRRFRTASLVALAALLAASCGSSGESDAPDDDTATVTSDESSDGDSGTSDAPVETDAPDSGDTDARPLRIGQVGDLGSLEPYRNASTNYLFIENVFDQLLVNEKNEGLEPEAATVELAPDNMSLTITLREGLTTHDGSVVDSEMLRYDFEERLASPDTGAAMYNALAPYYDSVEIVDDLTLKLNFVTPAPHAEHLMALMIIADPDMFVKSDGSVAFSNEEETQIGTGPYQLVEYVPDTSMTLEAFDGYWEDGSPAIERIDITFFGDSASMIAALESGQIDLAFNPPFDAAARLGADSAFTAWVPETAGVSSILMVNPEREHLRDPRVRQAINIAINRDAVNAGAYSGLAIPTASPVPPSSMAYTDELAVDTAGEPDRARELLAAAGAEDLALQITYPGDNDVARLSVEVVAQNLNEVGIDATLDPVDSSIWTERRGVQDFDVLWSLIAGANKHPAGLEDTFAYAHTDNQFFDDIEPQEEFERYSDAFSRALAATDPDEAASAWQEAVVAAADGSWVVILVGAPFPMVSTSDLVGVTWTEADKPIFKYATFQ